MIYDIITAISTAFMAIAIIASAVVAYRQWRNLREERKENYILEREALNCRLQLELTSNKFLLQYLQNVKFIDENNKVYIIDNNASSLRITDSGGKKKTEDLLLKYKF